MLKRVVCVEPKLDLLSRQMYHPCRKEERKFNACVFDKLVGFHACLFPFRFKPHWLVILSLQQLKKEIPGTPEGQEPIHEKKSPIYSRIQYVLRLYNYATQKLKTTFSFLTDGKRLADGASLKKGSLFLSVTD